MNQVTLMGNLGAEPTLRHTNGGTAVANMNVATNKTYVKDGKRVTKTEWHKIVVWGKLAEACAKYMTKGSKGLFQGELQTRTWENKNGVTQYTTEVICNTVEFISVSASTTNSTSQEEQEEAPVLQSLEDEMNQAFA